MIAQKKEGLKNNLYTKFILYFTYKFLLEIIYLFGIYKNFTGFSLNRISVFEYLTFNVIYFVMTYVMIQVEKINNNSVLILSMFNWFYFIPGLIFAELGSQDVVYVLLLLLFFFELNVIYILLSKKKLKKEDRVNKTIESNIYVYYFFIIISVIGLYICAKYNNLRLDLSLDNVYELRAEEKSIFMPTIFKYFKNWCAILIPIGVVYFYNKKESYINSLLIVTQLFLFSFGKAKSDLIILFFAFSVIFFKRKYYKKIFSFILIVTAISTIIALIDKDVSIFISYFYRRGMFLVSKISYEYFDFFIVKNNPVDLLRQSWLRHFGMASPYYIPIGNLIGKLYYGGIETNVCNGLIGDAIANFGILGVLIYPILYSIIFKIFDYITNGVDYKIILLVSIKFFISFSNGFLFQSLLTQGFIICLILFYFIKQCGRGKLLYNVQCSKEKINY